MIRDVLTRRWYNDKRCINKEGYNDKRCIPLQLMKAAVPAESYVIHLSSDLYSPAMSTGSSQVGAVLSPPC